jgi:hypothetical protein
MPLDYQRVLQVMSDAEAEGLDEETTLARVMQTAGAPAAAKEVSRG